MATLLRIVRPALLGVLLLITVAVRAQAPAWQRALVLGQAAGDISSIANAQADGAGNVFIAGSFTGSVAVGNTRLTSAGTEDIFVAKWSRATNSFAWAISAGGSGSDFVQMMTFSNGSLYLTGMFKSAACTFGNTVLSNAGNNTQDIFVTKVADAGSSASFGWAQRAGGSLTDSCNGIGVTATGVFIAGVYSGPAATFGTITLTAGGGFVAKFTEAGSTASFAWAQQTGSLINNLAVSGSNIYLIGNFASATVTFGTITLTSAGGSDVFVAKMTDAGTSGNFVWAVRAGGTGTEAGFGVAVAGTSIYVTGFFTSATCAFGSSTLIGAGGQDAYIAKLTDLGPSGAFVWGQRLGGTGNDYALSAAVQGRNVYLTGSFNSPTADAGTTILTNTGTGTDIFLAHLVDNGSSGDITWAQRAGGPGNDYGGVVSASGTEVFLVGTVAPPASFGAIALASSSTSVGFLASLTDAAALPTAAPAAETTWSLWPNPARATVQLVSAERGTLTLLDALGRVVRSYAAPVTAAGVALDVADLPQGLYLARLEVSGGASIRRLVIE